VVSNLAKATISAIDTRAAESAPGVLKVLTHQNVRKPNDAQVEQHEASAPMAFGSRNEIP
jgi:CO/xanthine dehydrogenase Mo-binding subunit